MSVLPVQSTLRLRNHGDGKQYQLKYYCQTRQDVCRRRINAKTLLLPTKRTYVKGYFESAFYLQNNIPLPILTQPEHLRVQYFP